MKRLETIPIRSLFSDEIIDFAAAQLYQRLHVLPESVQKSGITVSIPVPYTLWATQEKKQLANREAYESIIAHKDLFTFVRSHGIHSLEELAVSPYGNWFLWVKIKDSMACGQNCLILTHGSAPNRFEAYYHAKNYDDFWSVVKRLTDMYENPTTDHEPIILEKNNQICGSGYKCWQFAVK